MVFQEESLAMRWLPFLGRACAAEKDPQPEEVDLLSLAEMGLAHECSEHFLQPLGSSGKLSKFTVQRSTCRMQYRLFRDDGTFVMYAEARLDAKQVRFYSYDPDDKNGSYHPDRPAFKMEFDEAKTAWVLSHFLDGPWSTPSPRQGARICEEVLFVEHSREEVGDGLNYCLDAEFKSGDSMIKLVTRQAVWNEEMQTLVLNFKGREVVPSAKNFQVVLEGSPHRTVFQHGKLSSSTFALDFMAPLSIAQAFAMSVSTIFWE